MQTSFADPPDPAVIGSPIEDLDTPALLLDAVVVQRNIQRMADFFRNRLCRLRPHFARHKCPELARRQLAAGGAIGLACGSLREAEGLAELGFPHLLIANPVSGVPRILRLVELARRIQVRVAVDDGPQAEALGQAAEAARATLGVLMEVDVGQGCCGVGSEQAALDLARKIDCQAGLRLDGLLTRERHVVQVSDFERRAVLTRQAAQLALDVRRRIEDDGIPIGVLCSGTSATYQTAAQIDGIDEILAGTYPVMDWRYNELSPEFDLAMSVLARVLSKRPGAAVLDVGVTGIGIELGPPRLKEHPEIDLAAVLGDAHCIVRRAPNWRVGDAVELLPSHASTTCNLYRRIYVHEEGRVVEVWPIASRQ